MLCSGRGRRYVVRDFPQAERRREIKHASRVARLGLCVGSKMLSVQQQHLTTTPGNRSDFGSVLRGNVMEEMEALKRSIF